MKRVQVIAASDSNRPYLDFVPTFIEFWIGLKPSSEFTFVPKVFLVMDSIPDSLKTYSRYLELLPPRGLNSIFVAQNCRSLLAMDADTDFSMTTDIDMIPLSNKYFEFIAAHSLKGAGAMVIGRNVLDESQYPICYNLAAPATWKIALGPEYAIANISERLLRLFDEVNGEGFYSGVHGGNGWFIDQEFIFDKFNKNLSELQIIKLSDQQTSHRRIDRIKHRGISPLLFIPLIFQGLYADYHLPRLNHLNRTILKIIKVAVKYGRN
jgi:hypothetical protein